MRVERDFLGNLGKLEVVFPNRKDWSVTEILTKTDVSDIETLKGLPITASVLYAFHGDMTGKYEFTFKKSGLFTLWLVASEIDAEVATAIKDHTISNPRYIHIPKKGQRMTVVTVR